MPTSIIRIGWPASNYSINNSRLNDTDIAIVDSGINPHPDLNLLNNSVHFIGGSPENKCGHRTHVAGIAVAKDIDIGIIGSAPGARLWNVKVLEYDPVRKECSTTKSSLINGLRYVMKHLDEIDVVNLSLGSFCDPSRRIPCNSPILEKQIGALSKKAIVVVAAGNGLKDLITNTIQPDDSVNWKPANFEDIITVSNLVDSDGKCDDLGNSTYRGPDDFLANNSNFGDPVEGGHANVPFLR